MSRGSCITFDAVLCYGFKQSEDFSVIKCFAQPEEINVFSWVQFANLEVRGSVVETTVDVLRNLERSAADFYDDCNLLLDSSDKVSCLLLGSNEAQSEREPGQPNCHFALVLRPYTAESSNEKHCRVGLLRIYAKGWFSDVEVRRFVLL
jgi:hypothetical protein